MNPAPSAPAAPALPVALLGFGSVRHTRLRPVRHAFVYRTYFLMLPLRSLQAAEQAQKQGQAQQDHEKKPSALARNRWAALSFYDADHGDGRGPERGGALGWVEELLRSEGIEDALGEIWLHCYPRVWGHTFKPVSFWYCHRTDGSLRAIVVEVNNTFGERHCYLLDHPTYGAELSTEKVFHVSPFCPVEGRYRFRFVRTPDLQRTVARIDYDDASGPLLQTSVSGTLQPLTAASVRYALWHYPAMTWGVVARIHWQALRLWLRRVPFFRQPAPPSRFTTR